MKILDNAMLETETVEESKIVSKAVSNLLYGRGLDDKKKSKRT